MPHKIAHLENGAKTLETVVFEYKLNIGLSAEALSQKP
jgi:hypothetical protein